MGVRFPSVASPVQPANVTVSTTTETVLATTPPLMLPFDFSQVIILWQFQIATGTTTSGCIPTLRRGTTTSGFSVNVGNAMSTPTAGLKYMFSGCYVDVPGAVAGQQYSITVTQVAATANGTAQEAMILAFVL